MFKGANYMVEVTAQMLKVNLPSNHVSLHSESKWLDQTLKKTYRTTLLQLM